MFKYSAKNLKGKWVKGERMGKVKFIIESDFLKTNSIMKFAIGKGAKIEDYQQTLTEAETNGVRRFLEKVKLTCFSRYSRMIKPSCKTCDYNFICNQTPKNWNDEDVKKVEGL